MNEIPRCPKCDSEGYEYSISNRDRILYRCKKCHWRYNSISDTKLRASRLSDEQIELLHAMLYSKKWQIAQISRELQTTRATVYRYKRLWDSEQKEPDEPTIP